MNQHRLPIAGALVSVYTQERRNDTALFATGLPALSEFTIDMWYYGFPHDDDHRSNDWMISVAVPGTDILFRLHTNFIGKEIYSIYFALDISEASLKSIIGKEN